VKYLLEAIQSAL